MDDAPVVLQFTTANIKQALVEARGDIFIASQLLGRTAIWVQRAIDVSEELQNTYLETRRVKSNPEYARATLEEFQAAVDLRLSVYRIDGLDALHELAVMPIDENNSANNQVKLAAAARLAGTADGGTMGGEIADTLRSLNEMYHREAPRIRITRTEIEVSRGGERVINPENPSPA